ncbi:hypothetical protein V1527DRAFT_466297 [Lipomyces starkeyi]
MRAAARVIVVVFLVSRVLSSFDQVDDVFAAQNTNSTVSLSIRLICFARFTSGEQVGSTVGFGVLTNWISQLALNPFK